VRERGGDGRGVYAGHVPRRGVRGVSLRDGPDAARRSRAAQ
jgi:hypothetical protein